MPGMDKTGPQGEGPMTGRGLGKCDDGVNANPQRGRGIFGRFFRRGRGFRQRQKARDYDDRA